MNRPSNDGAESPSLESLLRPDLQGLRITPSTCRISSTLQANLASLQHAQMSTTARSNSSLPDLEIQTRMEQVAQVQLIRRGGTETLSPASQLQLIVREMQLNELIALKKHQRSQQQILEQDPHQRIAAAFSPHALVPYTGAMASDSSKCGHSISLKAVLQRKIQEHGGAATLNSCHRKGVTCTDDAALNDSNEVKACNRGKRTPDDKSPCESTGSTGISLFTKNETRGTGTVTRSEEQEGEEDEEDLANETFPYKLHRMLAKAEEDGTDKIISFTSSNKAFRIHKAGAFISEIMPLYFKTDRMSSFQRQLNLYGFRRVNGGPDKGAYFHEHFQKGQVFSLRKIRRKKSSTAVHHFPGTPRSFPLSLGRFGGNSALVLNSFVSPGASFSEGGTLAKQLLRSQTCLSGIQQQLQSHTPVHQQDHWQLQSQTLLRSHTYLPVIQQQLQSSALVHQKDHRQLQSQAASLAWAPGSRERIVTTGRTQDQYVAGALNALRQQQEASQRSDLLQQLILQPRTRASAAEANPNGISQNRL